MSIAHDDSGGNWNVIWNPRDMKLNLIVFRCWLCHRIYSNRILDNRNWKTMKKLFIGASKEIISYWVRKKKSSMAPLKQHTFFIILSNIFVHRKRDLMMAFYIKKLYFIIIQIYIDSYNHFSPFFIRFWLVALYLQCYCLHRFIFWKIYV